MKPALHIPSREGFAITSPQGSVLGGADLSDGVFLFLDEGRLVDLVVVLLQPLRYSVGCCSHSRGCPYLK